MRWSTLAATSQVGRQIVRRLCNYRLNHQSRLWSVWTTRRQIMRWLQKSFPDTFIVRRCYHFRDVIWMSNELIFTSWPKTTYNFDRRCHPSVVAVTHLSPDRQTLNPRLYKLLLNLVHIGRKFRHSSMQFLYGHEIWRGGQKNATSGKCSYY